MQVTLVQWGRDRGMGPTTCSYRVTVGRSQASRQSAGAYGGGGASTAKRSFMQLHHANTVGEQAAPSTHSQSVWEEVASAAAEETTNQGRVWLPVCSPQPAPGCVHLGSWPTGPVEGAQHSLVLRGPGKASWGRPRGSSGWGGQQWAALAGFLQYGRGWAL